jgi:hypothetical protein
MRINRDGKLDSSDIKSVVCLFRAKDIGAKELWIFRVD